MGLTVRQAALLVTAIHVLSLGGLLAAGLLESPTPPRVIQVSLQPSLSPSTDVNRRPPASLAAPAPLPKRNVTPLTPPPPSVVAVPMTPPLTAAPSSASAAPPASPAAPAVNSVSSSRGASATEGERSSSNTSASAINIADDRQPTVDASYRGNPLPVYPPMSRRLGEQGVVVLRVLIDTNGRAVDVEVQRSSGSARLDQAALQAIREWRFIPARRGGKPVPEWYEWRWEFRLNG